MEEVEEMEVNLDIVKKEEIIGLDTFNLDIVKEEDVINDFGTVKMEVEEEEELTVGTTVTTATIALILQLREEVVKYKQELFELKTTQELTRHKTKQYGVYFDVATESIMMICTGQQHAHTTAIKKFDKLLGGMGKCITKVKCTKLVPHSDVYCNIVTLLSRRGYLKKCILKFAPTTTTDTSETNGKIHGMWVFLLTNKVSMTIINNMIGDSMNSGVYTRQRTIPQTLARALKN